MVTSSKALSRTNSDDLHRRLRFWKYGAIAASVVSILSLGTATYTLTKNTHSFVQESGRSYYDRYLNFSLTIPYGWGVTTMKPTVESSDVVKSTGGLSFDMGQFSLVQDIAPVTMYVPSTEKGVPYVKYMILDFRGSDQNYTYLKNPVDLVNAFEKELKGLGETSVTVTQVKKVNNSVMDGILLQGSAKLKGVLYNYYRYFEPAGANILTITYGYTGTADTAVADISKVLNSLTYYRGGAFTASPFTMQNSASSSPLNTPTTGSSNSTTGIVTKVEKSKGMVVSSTPLTKK